MPRRYNSLFDRNSFTYRDPEVEKVRKRLDIERELEAIRRGVPVDEVRTTDIPSMYRRMAVDGITPRPQRRRLPMPSVDMGTDTSGYEPPTSRVGRRRYEVTPAAETPEEPLTETTGAVPTAGGYAYAGDYALTSDIGDTSVALRSKPHTGKDYALPAGTPVRDVGGKVSFVGDRGDGFGMVVEVYDPKSGKTRKYAHLSKPLVEAGQEIGEGAQVALSGGVPGTPGAGKTTGAHLHYEEYGGKPSPADEAPHVHEGVQFSPFDDVFRKHAGKYAGDDEFIRIVAAGTKAESGWDPNIAGDGGASYGLFQMHEKGAGAGMSVKQRTNPDTASSVMVPKYAVWYERGKELGLSGAELASYVARMAERPAGYEDPNSRASRRYMQAYEEIQGGGAAPAGRTPTVQPRTAQLMEDLDVRAVNEAAGDVRTAGRRRELLRERREVDTEPTLPPMLEPGFLTRERGLFGGEGPQYEDVYRSGGTEVSADYARRAGITPEGDLIRRPLEDRPSDVQNAPSGLFDIRNLEAVPFGSMPLAAGRGALGTAARVGAEVLGADVRGAGRYLGEASARGLQEAMGPSSLVPSPRAPARAGRPGPIDEGVEGIERGFSRTLRGSENTTPELREALEQNPPTYPERRSTRALYEDAAAEVEADPQTAITRILTTERFNDRDVAQAQAVIRRLQDTGDIESAARVAEHTARQLTEAGRTVQAASIWDRLSPEGVYVYANNVIRNAAEKRGAEAVTGRIQRTTQRVMQEGAQTGRAAADEVLTNVRTAVASLRNGMNDADLTRLRDSAQAAGLDKVVQRVDVLREQARKGRPFNELRQYMKDLEYLTDAETRAARQRIMSAEREAITKAKNLIRPKGVELPEELARSFLDRAKKLNELPENSPERYIASKNLMADVQSLVPKGNLDAFLSALNLPRSVVASLDFSAPFRQGLLLAGGHPRQFAKQFVPMFRAAFDDKYYQNIDAQLHTRPLASIGQKAGLYLAPVDGKAALLKREEAFASRFADMIPGIKQSQQGYVTFLNKLRADVFDSVVNDWQKGGYEASEKELNDLAHWINWATGRGDLGGAERAPAISNTLSQLFFSPRFLTSRIQAPAAGVKAAVSLASPVQSDALYSRQVAKQIAKSWASILAIGTGLLTLAGQGGAEVELDPRSGDFGKAKFGNLRIDMWGGEQQFARMLAQLLPKMDEQGNIDWATGARKTSSGKVVEQNRLDTMLNYARTKLSPQAGLATDALMGQTMKGREMFGPSADLGEQAWDRLMPMIIQTFAEAYQHAGPLGAVAATGLSAFGVGVQTYQTLRDAQNAEARRLFGKPYAELDAGEARQVQNTEAVRKNIEEFTARPVNEAEVRNTAFKLYNDRKAQLETKFAEQAPNLQGKALTKYIQGVKRSLFEAAQSTIAQLKQSERGDPNSLRDAYARAYWAIPAEDDLTTGEPNFKEQRAQREQVLAEAREAGVDTNYITERSEENFLAPQFDDPTVRSIMNEYARVQNILRPYWELRDDLVESNPSLQRLQQKADDARARGKPRVAEEFEKEIDGVARARKEVMRLKNREIEDALVGWYGYKPIRGR